ncbi:MAG: T9SS type A sorting domain-containing protein [candidate division WOR-3 bacterium]|nr:T9SS type A sorting domain-containing protein [candidate division WOR-3 bacterium]
MTRPVMFLITLLPALAVAQLDTLWLRTIDGGPGLEDVFSDMVVDDSGFVYITGATATASLTTDIFVRKYRPDGTVVWTATYNGRANQDDSASALVVDSLGNVFVCGWTMDTLMDMDMITIKYSPTGQLLWAKRWFRAVNRDDAAHALALDQQGRVIVTGYCSDASYNIDYCTICYNAQTGDTVWVRYYNRTPENDEDIPYALCIDDSSNIYVTGTSYDDGTDYDITTIRYRPNGTQTWLRRKNNWPWVGDDYGLKIAFDPTTRSVLVAGTVWDDNQDYNYFTMKYRATNGDSLWYRTYNRYPANNEDLLTALALDPAGNVFVTGTSFDDVTDYDIATVSYTASGMPRWTQRYDADGFEDTGAEITVDSLSQIFVLGTGESRINRMDMTILKYDNAGNPLYVWSWDNPAVHREDWGYRIAVHSPKYIFAAGTTTDDTANQDLLLMKLYEVLHDFAVRTLLTPESLYISDTLFPMAVISNLAINPDSCRAYLKIEPGPYLDSSWLVLTPGAFDTVQFALLLADTTGVITVTCWVNLAADERRFNDTLIRTVIVWQETTGLAENRPADTRLVVTITPNPIRTQAQINFSLPPEPAVTLRLFDRTGALVQQFPIQTVNGRTRFRLDLKNLPAGVYFLKADRVDVPLNAKVVIQH